MRRFYHSATGIRSWLEEGDHVCHSSMRTLIMIVALAVITFRGILFLPAVLQSSTPGVIIALVADLLYSCRR